MRTIKFKSLSSGSCGNCYFLGSFHQDGSCESALLIDLGVSPRRLKKELEKEGIPVSCIKGVLITHDHNDHIRALGSYCKNLPLPVWMTRELSGALLVRHLGGEYLPACRKILSPGWNQIDGDTIRARYFVVPHDATQTVGYAVLIGGHKFVIMTDIGSFTEEASLWACQADTVVIESNYDPDMLRRGPYPPELQERIRSGHGHLSNPECAQAIRQFSHQGLRQVFLCHLSEHNNDPALAVKCSREVLDQGIRLTALPRQTPSPLFELQSSPYERILEDT